MILDTNALSAFVDGDRAVGDILRTQFRAVIPVIVLGEFLYGITGSRHRTHYARWLNQNLPRFETLNVTADTATAYATIRAALKRAGTPIPANDLWIAALAVEQELPVLSRNTHFDAVTSLQRVTW